LARSSEIEKVQLGKASTEHRGSLTYTTTAPHITPSRHLRSSTQIQITREEGGRSKDKMISDANLYSLAVFLGSAAMLLIVLYHFLEINAKDDDSAPLSAERKQDALPAGKVKN
jgi:oligosaccharyl transferase complex subunit OST4